MACKKKKNGKSNQKWETCSRQKKSGDMEGDTDVFCRSYSLLTEPCLLTYYMLAAYYTFVFASDAAEEAHVLGYSVLSALPIVWLVCYLIYTKRCCLEAVCHGRYVASALTLFAVGEAILVYEPDFFLHVMLLRALAHIFLTGAMYKSYSGGAVFAWSLVPLEFAVMIGLYQVVSGYLSVMVLVIYGLTILPLTFLAVARLESETSAPILLGIAGTLLLQFSNHLYFLANFAPDFVCLISPEMIMITFYFSILFLGLSNSSC